MARALTFAALLALRRGQAAAALDYASRSIAVDPRRARAHHLRGLALQAVGRGAEALVDLRQAVAMDAKLVDARLDLGNALLDEGDIPSAAAEIEAVLAAEPASAIACNSLGNLRARQRQFDAAIAAYSRAIELDPHLSQAHGNLGMLQFSVADNDAAIASFRRAVALAPDRPANWSALLFALSVSDRATARGIAAEHRAFGERFAARIAPLPAVVPAPRAGRRLRIGYVSSDWRRHAVAVFAEPLLAAHDRDRFEIFCYQNYAGGDEVTARFAALADHFLPIASMPDAEAGAAHSRRRDRHPGRFEWPYGAQPPAAVFSQAGTGPGHLARLSGQHRRADDRLPPDRPLHRSAGAVGGRRRRNALGGCR